tara:strand:- start:1057 stop:2106 length:1050 start_codon:yes stop_codon:yes gene_type:complete
MKFKKLIIIILIVFLKTETLLSNNNLFDVDNIQIENNAKSTDNELANKAIKKGFNQLVKKILLKQDANKLSDLNFSSIKKLVKYYKISKIFDEENNNEEFLNFTVSFDKDKIHKLFYKKNILYSDVSDKEFYILPVLIKNDDIFIFNKNFFFKNWNNIYQTDLIEFISLLENIEIVQNINNKKDNLISIDIDDLFKEFFNKNFAMILIDYTKINNKKIYIKSQIEGKKISKSLTLATNNLNSKEINEKVITLSKKEIINLVKLQNLVDIRTPSFLNAKLNLGKKNNLVKIKSKIKNIDLVENVYVQQFNKNYVNLRIKYLGKFEKLTNQLKEENIKLQLVDDQWLIKIL